MKSRLILISVIFLNSFIYSQEIQGNSGPISFLSDIKHTGVFSEKAPASAPEVKIIFKTQGAVRSTPAVFQNKIYFGSNDFYFYCLDDTKGEEIWKFRTNGGITSSPAINKDRIYFSSKDGFLYCLDLAKGKEIWKFSLGKDLLYRWEYDYYMSSPAYYKGVIYIGSGNGNLYAVNAEDGKELWKYQAGSRIRSTAAISDGTLYFGDFAGKLHSVDIKTHKARWVFETDGSKIKIEEFGFDRCALVSSPSITDNEILFGSREGCLYCLDLKSGKLKWKDDQKMSWVISTPAAYKGSVIAGTSDGHFVKSINIESGQENWRYPTTTPVWSSAAIAGGVVFAGDYAGNFFALSAVNGKKLWGFKTEDRIHSSAVVHNGAVYFGSDDGCLYVITGSDSFSSRRSNYMKAVYWEGSSGFNWFSNRTDEFIRDFFAGEGYELLDAAKLKLFMEERIKDRLPSVVVFAKNDFPASVCNDSVETDLLREFLQGDNKAVLLGENPLAYIKNSAGKLTELDYRKASKYFGIQYGGELTDAIKGLYSCKVTDEGRRIGLKGSWVSTAAVPESEVTKIYARDENGRAACWLKNYGGPESSGLMQLWLNRQLPASLAMIKNAVEFEFKDN